MSPASPTNVKRTMGANWTREIAAWVSYMGAAGLSAKTIELRAYHLERIAAGIGGLPWSVTVERLTDWMTAHAWKPSTLRSYRGSLRAFYQWGVITGRCAAPSPAHQLPSVRVPRGRPRPVPEDAFRMALRIADKRARLAIMLAGICGLRRGEIARARRDHLEPDLIGWSLRVTGKGGHVRLVPCPDLLAREILSRPEGWLFPSSHGGHLTPHHLGKVVSQWLPEGHATHGLRHRCGTMTLRASNGNLRVVQEILGHAHLNTTAIYTLIDDDEKRAAIEAVA